VEHQEAILTVLKSVGKDGVVDSVALQTFAADWELVIGPFADQ
jgi:hypothetical protein